jgi:hypothetical protein
MEKVGGTKIMRKITKAWRKDENVRGRKRQARSAS